ncbi:MAG: hypothetical protein M1821_002919 [Bathelium mastoideum]|nr:MAG: hypothetical protein M1821_002919 [Bathelium mastoideum]KAI9694438.1 MAG: hypothetical protein M1822_000054 [Bathelium mastoideum]
MSSSTKPPGMKLKINTGASAAAAPPTPDPNPTPSLKLKLKKPTAPAPSDDSAAAVATALTTAPTPEKKKRKYTRKDPNAAPASTGKGSKKRARDGDEDSPVAKRVAKGSVSAASAIKSNGIAAPPTLTSRPSLPKIKIKAKQELAKPAITPRVRVKHSGQPPPRPPGVGYDSEASDVEVDPAIESQFILRMAPGDDCDYLRKAIEEKKLGLKLSEGGADVALRFLDREGRRSIVTIRGKHYAASMVDLPCVIESMKSWDRRGWWKSADLCQMLLVLGPVANEEAARTVALPREVDQTTWQYAHGLTPPMHWVRKRRFRKRVSYRTIEAVEDEVERLLEKDKNATMNGGRSEYNWLDLNAGRDSSESEQSDAEGENYYEGEQDQPEGNDYFGEGGDHDLAELEAEMEDALGNDDDQPTDPDHPIPSTDMAATPSSAEPNGQAATQEASEADDTGDDDDESDVNDGANEMDEEELAKQQEADQRREEIADLEREVQNAIAQMNAQTNPLLKQRLRTKVETLQNDLDLKRGMAGEESDS